MQFKARLPKNYMDNVPKRKKADPKKFAEAFKETGDLNSSMIAAGYSEKSARQGKARLSNACLAALMDEGITLGKTIKPEDRAAWVRGKLLQNTIDGKDVAVKSLELLGKDKEVQMFTPDSQVGVIILQAPEMGQLKEPPPMPEPVDVVDGEYV